MTDTTRRRKSNLLFQIHAENNDIVMQPISSFVFAGRNGEPPKLTNGKNKQNNNSADRRDNAPDSAFPPYRIMVVDDEPDAVSVLKKGLERKGFHVVSYTNPLEALSNFARHRYDIVLTDIRMPQMNGIDFFKQLRAIDNEVLICFVTAYDQFRRDFEIAHPDEQIGCFIPKPISIDRLVSTITRKMEERENRWRGRI